MRISYLQAIRIPRAEVRVLGAKYIQTTTTLHRGFPQALPGFQAEFLVFSIHAQSRGAERKKSTCLTAGSWERCGWNLPWLPPG